MPGADAITAWWRSATFGSPRPAVHLLVLAMLGVVRGLLETAVVLQVVALAFAVSGAEAGGLRLPGGLHPGPFGLLGVITLTIVAAAAAQWWSERLVTRSSATAMATLRSRLYAAYCRASWLERSHDRAGSLQDLLSADVAIVANGTLATSAAVVALFQLLVVVGAAIAVSPWAAMGVALTGVIVVAVAQPFRLRTREIARRSAQHSRSFAVTVAEMTQLAREQRIFGVDDVEISRADALIAEDARLFGRVRFEGSIVPALTRDGTILAIAAGIAVLSTRVQVPVGALGATAALLMRAIGYGQQTSATAHALTERRVRVERFLGELTRYEDAAVAVGGLRVDSVGSVGFEEVALAYPGAPRPALAGVSLSLGGGQLVGLVGPSGSGKTTFAHLVLRLLEPNSGRLLADGVDAARISLEDWYRRVAFVPQDPRLLTGTIAENIRFRRTDLSDEAVNQAARLAALGAELDGWAEGLDHPVGSLGTELSIGQRQRVALARALVGEPDVLVLDEPTSALDGHSEAAVRAAVEALRGRVTVVVIAHRLSTLETCDRIIVLRDGCVTADGSPSELAAGDPYFQEALALSGLRP